MSGRNVRGNRCTGEGIRPSPMPSMNKGRFGHINGEVCRKGDEDVTVGPSEPPGPVGGDSVGTAAIKWGAVVIIVIAVLWFLARYVVPLAR